jgi:hypothetical protein
MVIKTKENEVVETCRTHGEIRNVYKSLIVKPERMISLGRPRHRWQDDIKMDLTEIWCEGDNWI